MAWNKQRVEFYAGQVLNALMQRQDVAGELIGGKQKPHTWAEHWSDVAFDIAEVFAAEADNRDDDVDCRLIDGSED